MRKPKAKTVPRFSFETHSPGADSPGPGSYNHIIGDEKRRARTPVYKFGERFSIPPSEVQNTPGPGMYAAETIHRGHQTKSPSHSFGSRPARGNPVAHASPEHVDLPGPGHYRSSTSPATPRSARATLSRTASGASLNSTGSGQKPSSSFGTSPRFKSSPNQTVGPGSYEVGRATPMSKKGVKIGKKIAKKPPEVFDLLYTPAVDTLGNRTMMGHSGRQK